MKLNLIINY